MGLDVACATDIDEQPYRKSHKLHRKLLSILSMTFTTSRTKQATKLIDDIDEQSVLYPHASLHPCCIFCGASKENGFNVVWEVSQMSCFCSIMYVNFNTVQNDVYTVFTDINPSAEHHLQVIPKRHIGMQVLLFLLTAYLTRRTRKCEGFAPF